MLAVEFVRLTRKQPFEPFMIHMSDGASYPIRHPQQMVITHRAVHVGITGKCDLPGAFDDVAICSLVHVTGLTPGVSKAGANQP